MKCEICNALTVTYKSYDDKNDKYVVACEMCIVNKQLKFNEEIKIDNAEITINQLIDAELVKANRKFPPFKSAHEGWAVILEEIQESDNEMNTVIDKHNQLWKSIKLNHENTYMMYVDIIENATIRAIKELIQVAAMCEKFGCLKEDDYEKVKNDDFNWEYKGNRCSNCHAGILEDEKTKSKRCTMNYPNCDYYNPNYESFINTNHEEKKEDDK